MQSYLFENKLIKGLIKSRPNRFIMMVEIDGKLEKCHCPSTGKIGNIEFLDIACLLSKSDNPNRKTKYTVEAIYPNKKTLVGINQTKANSYIEFFLRNNLLNKIVKVKNLKREVKLNNSRIDFFVNNNCFIEVKTLLIHLPFGENKKENHIGSFDRLIKHFADISSQIKKKQKAIIILCYLYNAGRFEPPKNADKKIEYAVKKAIKKGMENWQVNLKIDSRGVSLIDYFKLNLFLKRKDS